jgi:hypothetical protein
MNNSVYNSSPSQLLATIYGMLNGSFAPIQLASNGGVETQIIDSYGFESNIPLSAFKDIRVAQLTPECGWTFHYTVNTDIVNVTTTGNGTVTQTTAKGVLQTGNAQNSSAKINSRRFARYIPGMGLLVLMTCIFTIGVSGSSQLIGLGDNVNGLFFGYNGDSFGVMRRQNGTDNWIPQSSWNLDKLDGTGTSGITVDTTKGNIYGINFQWLGYGLITFMVANPQTGYMIPVNQIRYANSSSNPHILSPNLPVMATVANTTNNTNITLQSPCAICHIEGQFDLAITTNNAIDNSKNIASNTETNILSLQNKLTVNSLTNNTPVILMIVSVNSDGNQPVTIRLKRNVTFSSAPIWTDINTTNSIIAYDTQGVYSSGTGKLVTSFQLQKADAQFLNIFNLQISLQPGETITVTALSSSVSIIGASLTWREYY